MANLSEDIQCASSDTRPPMLDRTDFASWQQRIRLYCRSKENGVNILKSIDEGPYQMGTVRETLAESTEGAPQFGPKRSRVYSDLTSEEKDQYNADIRAINILLQGLPKDIYTLINHYTDAKDIWDNVKMLLEGSELTKGDWESQLYDDFEHFRQHKGESIHDYYVRFAKLINDMRNIKMTISRLQLNSKFVNNMLPEWGRFVTAVKLNRVLRDFNYDQLNQATVQDGRVVVQNVQGRPNRGQGMNPQGGNAARYRGAPNRVGNVNLGPARPGQARPGQARPAQENRVALDAEQLLFLAGGQDNTFNDDVDEQPVQDLALNVDNVFQANNCDAFDSDVDEAPTAQTMFMANLSFADPVIDEVGPSYDSDILSEYVKDNEVPVVHSDASSVPTDAFMMIYNDMITPTGLTEGEMGFEQTKECYLKEVIPFFKTLKDNFEGIQKALTKEIKEMKDVFKELEAEVAQYAVDRKHDAIERKNLLIVNDSLIVECLTQEVFSVATNFELNVARFTKMHVANTTVESRCLALKAELANLRDNNNHDNQKELINHFSKLEGKDNVIRQLKKQLSQLQVTHSDTDRTPKHYKEPYDFIKITRAKHIKQVTKLTAKNVNLKSSVSKDTIKPQVLVRAQHAIYVEPIFPRLRNNRDAHLDYLRHLKESVETIRDIVEEAKVVRPLDRSIVSACRYTKHSQELLEYVIGTCPQGSQP
nr:integrase, catalytic region, zinc finger, CCHC-type, peptidase aspartic, catalytic [Tanacetum cinerariifolium]